MALPDTVNSEAIAGAGRKWTVRGIRTGVRNRWIAFPSEIPVFACPERPDVQWRIVSLYFVRGWATKNIASRYGVTRERVMQILRQWTARAISRGYVDVIPRELRCAPD
jgi:Sigma-70, region 4